MLDALQANDGQVDGDEEVDQYEDPQHYEVNPFANFSPESEVMWNRLVAEPALTIDGKPRHELDGCLWYNKGHTPNKWGFHLKWRCCDPDCQATASSFRKEVDGVDFNVKALRPHTTSDMAASFCQQIQNFELLKLKARWFITRLCLHEEYRYSVARDTVLALMNAFNPSSTNDFALGPLEQTVKTKRRKLFPAVPTLGNQELFDLPPLYRKTISGELFLLCNCTINGATPGRMMVFATGSFLANLFQVLRVHIDGTFKPTPRPFTQLFTIHAFVGGVLIPFVYVFMTHKTMELYRILLRWLKSTALARGWNIAWTTITCDFKSGLIPAITEEIPHVVITGCWFHWTQAILRKLSVFELINNELHAINSFEGFVPAVVRFRAYLTSTWMTADSLYPPRLWNLYAVEDNVRSNNNLESWNKQLSVKCETARHNFWQVVHVLQREQSAPFSSWTAREPKGFAKE